MHIHLNAGSDIEIPEQMFEAILSSSGVLSLRVTLCESITNPLKPAYKIDGGNTLSNIEFSKEGTRVWRAYAVGPGKLISSQKSKVTLSESLPSIVEL